MALAVAAALTPAGRRCETRACSIRDPGLARRPATRDVKPRLPKPPIVARRRRANRTTTATKLAALTWECLTSAGVPVERDEMRRAPRLRFVRLLISNLRNLTTANCRGERCRGRRFFFKVSRGQGTPPTAIVGDAGRVSFPVVVRSGAVS